MEACAEYAARLTRWLAARATEQRRFHTIGNLRLATVTAGAAMLWLAAFRHVFSALWVFAPVAVFIALAVWHERVAQRELHASRAIRFYERGMDRLEDRWAGRGNPGTRFLDPEHLYAGDVDLFGKGSLFELLSTARTTAGEATLAAWLTQLGSVPSTISAAATKQRQESVSELRDKLDLREDLATIGPETSQDIRALLHEEQLASWGAAPPVAWPAGVKLVLYGVPLLSLAATALWIAGITGPGPLLVAGVGALVAARYLGEAAGKVFYDMERPAHELRILSLLLERLERETWSSPRLIQLATELESGGMAASAAISALHNLVERRDWSHNMVFQIPARLLLWDEHHAVLMEAWRARWGAAVGRWTLAIGECEALCSLAAFTLEHADGVFPEFSDEAGFDAEALRHPLMSARQCVANDVTLGGETRLWIVSGSNMSGKSTLLRAVALNTVLAWAGAPVLARRLRISRLVLGASIRVVDSLQDGRSHFYAEITRLRHIADLAGGETPLLFLIDELLHGTNSHDRRIGGEAVLRALVDRGALGMVTTHDLALAAIANALDSRAANVHFEDRMEAGAMHFDYRLHPGVVTHSNALELMRSVGLLP